MAGSLKNTGKTHHVLMCWGLATATLCSPELRAVDVDTVTQQAIERCADFGFVKGTMEFAQCAAEQAKVISQSVTSTSSAQADSSSILGAENTNTEQHTDIADEFDDLTVTQGEAGESLLESPSVLGESRSGSNPGETNASDVNVSTNTLKFEGTPSFARSATIVPTGAIEVDVQSNKGGAAFGLIGAIVEGAATSGKSQSDEAVIAQYLTSSETDPRLLFARILGEYLGSCFSETEVYTSVVQPLLGAKAWRLKEKRLDETRYEVVPTTDYIIEAKLTYSLVKTLLGTQLMVPINVSIFRRQDLREVKRFSSVPNKLFGEFSALDGVSELDAPTGDVLRDGAMKISNKVCKAKL